MHLDENECEISMEVVNINVKIIMVALFAIATKVFS